MRRLWFLALTLVILLLGRCATRPSPPSTTLQPFAGIAVFPQRRAIEIDAWVCLDAGWLEQIACSPNTREHETLVVIKAPASDVHVALLLAGFTPGAPGSWTYDNEVLSYVPPSGDRLRVLVRYEREGRVIEERIGTWIVDAELRPRFPDTAWVFAGSSFADNPAWMGPGEHFVADITGSIIGLVTFGDEVVGFQEVLADEEAVQPPQWQVRTDYVPPIGTAVTVILEPAD
jgi:hypothetical protein